jgi:DNA-directed RNA polymerase specialized sigma24 family protein
MIWQGQGANRPEQRGQVMFESSAGATRSRSDADILNAIRSGDPVAYGLLRRRHMPAARRLAQFLLSGSAAAEDAVDQAFENVLAAVQRGGGPTDAFRPYLLSAVREATAAMPGQPAGGAAGNGQPGPTQPGGPRPDLVVAAFLSLPERWRAVLWHVCVEGESPAEAGALLGLPEPDAAELASQAREALSLAYHRRMEPGARNNMTDVDGVMRTAVAPAILGRATGAYLTRPLASPPPPPGRAGAAPAASAGSANGAGRGNGAAPAKGNGAGPAKKASKRRTAARPSGRRRAAAPEAAGLGAAGAAAAAGPGTGPEGGVPGPSAAGQAGSALPRTAWTELPGTATPAAAAGPASLNGLPSASGWGPVPVDRRTVWTGAPIASAPGVPGAPGSAPLGQTAPGTSPAGAPGTPLAGQHPREQGRGLPAATELPATPGATFAAGAGRAAGPAAPSATAGPGAPAGASGSGASAGAAGAGMAAGAAASSGAAGAEGPAGSGAAASGKRSRASLWSGLNRRSAASGGSGQANGPGSANGPGTTGAAGAPGTAGSGAASGPGANSWTTGPATPGGPGHRAGCRGWPRRGYGDRRDCRADRGPAPAGAGRPARRRDCGAGRAWCDCWSRCGWAWCGERAWRGWTGGR